MRVAAALHIFAAQLYMNIFRPWYVPESVEESWTTRNILNRHFGARSRKGNIVRALLLSNRQTEDENNAVADVAREASEYVHEQLRLFLSDDGTEFQARLEEAHARAHSRQRPAANAVGHQHDACGCWRNSRIANDAPNRVTCVMASGC